MAVATDERAPGRSFAGLAERCVDALTGPRRHGAVGVALAVYGAVWIAYRVIATLPRDIHFDMSELYAWSLAPALGYDKHPPLSAWVVRIWFALFPVDAVSFTALAVMNVVVTLYIAWRILERWTDPLKAAFGLALLTFVPFYNFQALKYNANTVLLPVWAFTAYAFLRAFEARSALWGAIAGACAGAAMLGKYWSVFLVAGFVVAALLDRRRGAFLRSPAPYMMVLAGAAVIAPHILWIAFGGGDTLGYAGTRLHGHDGTGLSPTLRYAEGLIGYALGPLAVWALLLRPSLAVLGDTVNPDDAQRRLALFCFLLPNALPLIAGPWLGGSFTPLWALPGYSLLPLVLLASPRLTVSRRAVKWGAGLAAALSFGALLASPLVATIIHLRSNPRPADYGSMLARDVIDRWTALSTHPLPYVFSCGADTEVAYAVAYDLRLPTRALAGRQGLGARAALLDRGGVIVGAANDPECRPQGDAIAAMRTDTTRFEPTYKPRLFGIEGRPFGYIAYVVPPP